MAVNCTAIPDSLFESEMFGIEKGVATGVTARRGLIEEASGGTLFLDELADMSLANQAKLLRVLEEREVLRVGSSKPVPGMSQGHCRNQRGSQGCRAGRQIPRGSLLPDQCGRAVPAAAARTRRRCTCSWLSICSTSTPASCSAGHDPGAPTLQCLRGYNWPGNVRELSNEMERAAALTVDQVVRPSDLSRKILDYLAGHGGLKA